MSLVQQALGFRFDLFHFAVCLCLHALLLLVKLLVVLRVFGLRTGLKLFIFLFPPSSYFLIFLAPLLGDFVPLGLAFLLKLLALLLESGMQLLENAVTLRLEGVEFLVMLLGVKRCDGLMDLGEGIVHLVH